MTQQARDSDYAHLAPIFQEYASLDPEDPARETLRGKLVTGYLPVVQHIARRFAGRGEPVDDLEQAGTIGLINAVDRFEPDRGTRIDQVRSRKWRRISPVMVGTA